MLFTIWCVAGDGARHTGEVSRLEALTAGMPVIFGGNQVAYVDDDLAAAFQPGDRLVVVQHDGALLHVSGDEAARAEQAVDAAHTAFGELRSLPDAAITTFFDRFAALLESETAFLPIAAANELDIAAAKARGRSTTRLELNAAMRAGMVSGLRSWRDREMSRDDTIESVEHHGWSADLVRAPLGVVGFVFEGRPNVFADATGVLRSGNTVVFRIGSDALGTARAIVEHALAPALAAAGLPAGAAVLLDSPARSAGWALFSQPKLSLAVARGSGAAVEQLGAVARQHGIPVSLHGKGGAWLVAGLSADAVRFERVVTHSLDRKVCNTLNVCCVVRSRAAELLPLLERAANAAADRRGVGARLHVVPSAEVPDVWWSASSMVRRADGDHTEPFATAISSDDLAIEWEWEDSPELSVVVVDTVDDAVSLFNTLSPRFGVSLVADDPDEHERFWQVVDAPFVGDGMTRWVDGQFTLNKPELGLSNWQHGRLFARSGILAGDSVHTIRVRMRQSDIELHR